METPPSNSSVSSGKPAPRRAARSSRRPPACERCNKRRVKCDASVVGQPCSGCFNSGNHDCRLIQSKRTRGSGGRFIVPRDSIGGTQSQRAESEATTSTSKQPTSKHPKVSSPKTAQNPQFSLNLGKLYDDGGSAVANADAADHGETTSATNQVQIPTVTEVRSGTKTRPVLVGESWFASFLAHNAASGTSDTSEPVKIARENGEIRAESTNASFAGEGLTNADTAAPVPGLPKDLPPQNLMRRLIEVFFSHFHVYFPILDKSSFILSVEDGSVSITLLRSVLFVGSTQCAPEIYHLLGFSTRNDAGDELFGMAKASFDSDSTSDRTNLLQSCFLLHYWWGQPTAFKDSLWWFTVAIRSAQCMGMHKTTRNSSLSKDTQILWKRIWWCLYIRDRQLAFALGVPMVINDMDCSVEDLTMDDFPNDSLATANYVMEQVNLNRLASELFFRHCSPTRLPLCDTPEARHLAQQDIQATLQTWHDAVSHRHQRQRRHHLYLTLDLCYYFLIINLQQRLQNQSIRVATTQINEDSILEAANSITRLVEDAMIYWSPEYFPMMWITAIFASMNVHFVSYRSLNKQGRELILTKLRTSLIALKQFEECYILARWVRILWNDIFDRSGRKTINQQSVPPAQASPTCSYNDSHGQNPSTAQQSADAHGTPAHSQAGELDYGHDWWLEASPYSTTDWSNLVFSGDYDTSASLPLITPTSIDSDGLQFLATLGLGGHYSHYM